MKQVIATQTQLAQALRSVRKSKGLSQGQAGKLVGILPKTISALENHPESASIDSLFKLLSALGLELTVESKMPTAHDRDIDNRKHEEW